MNKRQIAKALSSAAFTPGKLGPMKIIADVGNINYYIRRATEFLTLSLTALTREQRVKYFDCALGLIALAKVKTQETEKERCDFTNPEFLSVKKCSPDDFFQKSVSESVSGVKDVVIVKKDNNEVDKQDKDGEVQGTGNSVPPLGVFRDIPDPPDGCQSPRQISEETQPRPEAPFYAIDT